MARELFAIVSYKAGSLAALDAEGGTRLSTLEDPGLVTLGFRKIFWKVFSEGGVWRGSSRFTWLEHELEATEMCVVRSDGARLDGMEGEDFVVVLRLETGEDPQELYEEVGRIRVAGHIDEQEMVRLLEDGLESTPCGRVLGSFGSDYPGIQLWAPEGPVETDGVETLLAAFYYYGWLIIQRLDRSQADVELAADYSKITEGVRSIADERVRLINLDRYFLTTNRSTLPAVQEVCRQLVERFHLKQKYERHLAVHQSLERHLGNTAQLIQENRSRLLNRSMSILTFLAMPIGIFSAVMAVSLSADVIKRPTNLLLEQRLWLTVAFSFLVPLVVLGIAIVVDRVRSRRASEAASRARG
jgi:hypothetical protein